MTKFLVVYRAEISAQEQMANTSPEQARAGMDAWMAWASKAGDAIVDLGMPLRPCTHLGAGTTALGDAAGFSIMQGESLDAVTEVLASHPHLEWGGTIDVLEFLALPGMG